MKTIKIKGNTILKNIFTMSAGTILAQSINVLVQPILTRIVPTETLGVYGFLISLATIIIPVASLKLDMLVVSETDDCFAQYITDVCILLCAIISILYLIVIGIAYLLPINSVFKKYGIIIFIVPFIVFTNGIRFLFISYNNRYKQYKLIAGVGFLREGLRAIIQVCSGLLHFGIIGQVLGYALAPVFGFGVQTKGFIQKRKERKRISVPTIIDVLKKGKKQIFFLVPAQFINSFSASFVTICITSLYSAEALGYYSVGNRILEIPIIFIAANTSKVCYKEISEKVANREAVFPTMLRIVAAISVISCCGFSLLYLIAPQLSEFVFGKGYYISGVYIKCLCLMYAARLISTSFAGLFTIFGKQHYEFLLNFFLVIVAVIVFFVSNSIGVSIESYLWLICIGYTIMYLIMLGGYIVLCKKHDKSICQS